jgi:hypothetical protein
VIESDEPAFDGMTGVVVDHNDQPLAGLEVQACTTRTCYIGESGDDGRFAFALQPPLQLAIKTHADTDRSPRRAAGILPVTLDAEADVDVGRVFVVELPSGVPLGPDTADPRDFEVGHGLALTLVTADLSPAFGERLSDLAAAPVLGANTTTYPELGAEQVLSTWALHPFGATSTSVIGVRAPTDLPAGAQAWIRTINPLDGTLSPPVPATSDGAVLATDPGAGVDQLTWLIISR